MQPCSAILEPLAKGNENGPFGRDALKWLEAGKAVIPLDGKKSAVGNWQLMGRPASRKLATNPKFAGCNLGVLTGWINNLTIVDIDTTDPKVAEFARDVFGEPCVVAETATGKPHFFYRYTDENKLHNPFRDDSRPMDILGNRAYAAAPPSERDGRAYRFIRGGREDLGRLAPLKAGWRDALPPETNARAQTPKAEPAAVSEERQRNSRLFLALKDLAMDCRSRDDLLTIARGINSTYRPPMEEARVISTVNSVWKYKRTGNLISKDAPGVIIRMPELIDARTDAGGNGPDGLVLLATLRQMHGGRGEPFAISPKAMARERVLGGWAHPRYARARDWILLRGHIVVVKEGGGGVNDPYLFAFASKGPLPLPNITYVPPAASRPPIPGEKGKGGSSILRAATEASRAAGRLKPKGQS